MKESSSLRGSIEPCTPIETTRTASMFACAALQAEPIAPRMSEAAELGAFPAPASMAVSVVPWPVMKITGIDWAVRISLTASIPELPSASWMSARIMRGRVLPNMATASWWVRATPVTL